MITKKKLNIEGLIPFALAGVLFGLLYNAFFYPHTLVEFAEAGTIGLLLGIISGLAEQVLMKKWFFQLPFNQTLIIRTIIYSVAAAVSLAIVLSIEPASLGECTYVRCLIQHISSPLFFRDLIFTTIFVFLVVFVAQVVLFIGTRNFIRLIRGHYRKPQEIFAIFMFVDLRSSTRIAEKLGHELFSELLRDFFNDISGPIHDANGEEYQYVGDEVVIVWPERPEKEHMSWLSCFEEMKKVVDNNGSVYLEKYGLIPEFKAGAHGGLVVVTEVGALQKAIVYHGDVLNTTSRIQNECNKTGFDLLASEALLSKVEDKKNDEFVRVGSLPLRGKKEEVTIYGSFPTHNKEQEFI